MTEDELARYEKAVEYYLDANIDFDPLFAEVRRLQAMVLTERAACAALVDRFAGAYHENTAYALRDAAAAIRARP